MKINKYFIGVLLAFSLVFVGCSGNGTTSSGGASSTTITVVDGYIKDGNLTDATGAQATYSPVGKYTFSGTPQYPLTFTGGVYVDTNASFDINMTAQSGLILSPLTTFLENNASLQTKLAIALSVSDSIDSFAVDYVDINNSDLAKLSQLLYMVHKDAALKNKFKTTFAGATPASLNDIFTLVETDVNATIGIGYALSYRAFLDKVKSLNGAVSTYETKLENFKTNLNDDLSPVTHNTTTYGVVISSYTGKAWLDRNLGASQVCTALNDTACYGDYYQWGRNYDGHQVSTSTTTATLATGISSVGTDFITPSSSPYDWTTADSDGALRSANWSKTDGSSICPVGYRTPTITELAAETTSASTPVTNGTDAFNNFLKLPSAGRHYNNGSMGNQGSGGRVWSGSVSGSYHPYRLDFDSSNADTGTGTRAHGFSVRCLKD